MKEYATYFNYDKYVDENLVFAKIFPFVRNH